MIEKNEKMKVSESRRKRERKSVLNLSKNEEMKRGKQRRSHSLIDLSFF